MSKCFAFLVGVWTFIMMPFQVFADESICGTAPSLPPTSESAESIKGQLSGKADFLSRFVGQAELGGQIEAARKDIYKTSPEYFPAQKDAYLAYIFCVVVMRDAQFSTKDRLDAINKFRQPVSIKEIDNSATSSNITVNYNVCVGQHQDKCPQNSVHLSCGSSIAEWARKECKTFSETKLSDIGGNKCGYYVAQVTCSKSLSN